jgi:hypothetical protein
LNNGTRQEAAGLKPSPKAQVEILDGFVRADKQQNDLPQLLTDLEALKEVSPGKEAIEKDIEETRAEMVAPGAGKK